MICEMFYSERKSSHTQVFTYNFRSKMKGMGNIQHRFRNTLYVRLIYVSYFHIAFRSHKAGFILKLARSHIASFVASWFQLRPDAEIYART